MQPVNNSGHNFWDHLSLTRADEYAAEDDLARLPIPPAPVKMAPPVDLGQQAQANMRSGANADPSAAVHSDTAWPKNPYLSPAEAAPAVMAGHWPEQTMAPIPDYPMASAHLIQTPRRRRSSRSGTGRFAYRAQRLWLTPLVRRAVTVGLPVAALIVTTLWYLSDEGRRADIRAQVDAVYALVVDRPEFMVTGLDLVQPLPPAIEAAIRDIVDPVLPESSFRLDLAALRAELERLDAIRLADLRLTSDGKLAIGITQRVPAILWRSVDGLEVLDAEGVRIGFVTDRAALADLPLLAGDDANLRVGEALDLIEAASPLGPRVLGLVRMGERRWDVVLDREQIIRLPETAPVAALERIIALDQAQGLLARDVVVTDLRNPTRPVLQISAGALETIRASRTTYSTGRNAP